MKSTQRVLKETGSMNAPSHERHTVWRPQTWQQEVLNNCRPKRPVERARRRDGDGHSLPGWVKCRDITESTLLLCPLLVPLAGTHAPTGQTQCAIKPFPVLQRPVGASHPWAPSSSSMPAVSDTSLASILQVGTLTIACQVALLASDSSRHPHASAPG